MRQKVSNAVYLVFFRPFFDEDRKATTVLILIKNNNTVLGTPMNISIM